MDEIKLSIKTKFMRDISKLIGKLIFKQTGVKVEICLTELDIINEDGYAYIDLELMAKVDEKEIIKAMSKL